MRLPCSPPPRPRGADRVPHPADEAPPASWYGPHKSRDLYISLLSLEPPPPQPILVAALLRRALDDVKLIWAVRDQKAALSTLLAKGQIGDDTWERFLLAEKELEAEIIEVVGEANAFQEGYGQNIFPLASEMATHEKWKDVYNIEMAKDREAQREPRPCSSSRGAPRADAREQPSRARYVGPAVARALANLAPDAVVAHPVPFQPAHARPHAPDTRLAPANHSRARRGPDADPVTVRADNAAEDAHKVVQSAHHTCGRTSPPHPARFAAAAAASLGRWRRRRGRRRRERAGLPERERDFDPDAIYTREREEEEQKEEDAREEVGNALYSGERGHLRRDVLSLESSTSLLSRRNLGRFWANGSAG